MADQNKWHKRFLQLAREISYSSKDPSTKVGAVLVNKDREIVGTGYNGFPRGVKDSEERLLDRETKYKFTVHAEVNACITAGKRAKGGTLYVWPSFAIPNICHECTKVAIQSGIARIVGFSPDPADKERAKRWIDSINLSRQMLEEAGVEIVEVTV